MVAKVGRGPHSLVCVDCGHPANSRSYQESSRRHWRAAMALVAFSILTGLILSLALLQEFRHREEAPEPAATERSE
jgi:hypothetical protein